MTTYLSSSAKQTRAVASALAKKLKRSAVVTLSGELGSGKTQFVKGLARGLGIKQTITSPTFILLRSYRLGGGKKRQRATFFSHLDLYRIKKTSDLDNLGLTEILNRKNHIIAIEWPEKIKKLLPKNHIRVFIDHYGNASNQRRIKIVGVS
ncbi:MAG: tRNA (adenosine(37)-N6)-threonylcarbamoyltransferase complex ATPase subunit type 1 TsaE [Candidatus Doudnabacteria bacterium]|nr:tRNA (adenosine(37)-N6)-threonylcarbamoyltransferase complex ATPase subunit type 1 TsaE [Candidatus Doudnabacteria bacterium]